MQYRVETGGGLEHIEEPWSIAIVGCGGTGGFVAEQLCRLLGDQEAQLVLIDMDRVEPHNLVRQAFYEGDVGQFKSQVLATRLSRLYGRKIGYSVHPYTANVHRTIFGYRRGVIVGCVDNPLARAEIAEGMMAGGSVFWLDAGNGHHSGQVLIGNAVGESMKGSFFDDGHCLRIPIPSVQLPALLAPVPAPEPVEIDCAEAVATGDQSATINQEMSNMVVTLLERLFAGTLNYMGEYVDQDLGTRQRVAVEPQTVARIIGQKVDFVMAKKTLGPAGLPTGVCPNCGRVH